MAKFDLNDDGLVVIVGSGAGGGTLGNELAQKGIKAVILEAGDTALVLAKTLVSAKNSPTVERKATYVFRKDAHGTWRCAIDNSYGHEMLETTG